MEPDHPGGRGLNAKYYFGVLGGQAGDGAGAVHAQRGEGMEISLDAGATAAIGAGNGEGHGFFYWLMSGLLHRLTGSGNYRCCGGLIGEVELLLAIRTNTMGRRGLDMFLDIAFQLVPIAGIIADESAIGVINDKTTAVRIIPAVGKQVGDYVDYGGLLGRAPIMPVSKLSSSNLLLRGGRFPAPMRSLTN